MQAVKVPFSQKNPTVLGVAALTGIAVGLSVALNLDSIPLFHGGTTSYHAHFAEAAGLREGEEVRIAGVKVGKVTGLELDGNRVRVDFRVDDGVRIGDESKIDIKIKTLLGAHFLAVDPRGAGRQDPDRAIPVSRTSTPYEVVPAIADLSKNIDAIDTDQLAESFDTLSATFENSPEEIKASLRGLRRISQTISKRDDELNQLLIRAKDVTGVLNERSDELVKLMQDGDKLLQAVQNRRDTIHQLLVNTYRLAQQLNAVIDENEDEIKPLLANLQKVTKVLLDNRDNLDRSLQLMAVYARQFADATGTGRWFDSYIQNFIPLPASIGDPSKEKKPSSKNKKKSSNEKSSGNGSLPLLP
ncbi:MCE family protein [Actinocorallia libanotica]|uniref:MCE family protein n=1 Tax=Actinocorallia libanotica TaxID=46162 RepID=A0ABP4CAB6_9ACTN